MGEKGTGEQAIPKDIVALRARVRRLYQSWWIAHYSLGLTGVIAGALLTAASAHDGASPQGAIATLREWAWILGIFATVCTSLVTLLGPLAKAQRYWNAFHILDQAFFEYQKELIDLKKFARRVNDARKALQVGDAETAGTAMPSPIGGTE